MLIITDMELTLVIVVCVLLGAIAGWMVHP